MGWTMFGTGLSQTSEPGGGSGLIPGGKAEMQDSLFLPGPRGSQQRSVRLCEVYLVVQDGFPHVSPLLPSW